MSIYWSLKALYDTLILKQVEAKVKRLYHFKTLKAIYRLIVISTRRNKSVAITLFSLSKPHLALCNTFRFCNKNLL